MNATFYCQGVDDSLRKHSPFVSTIISGRTDIIIWNWMIITFMTLWATNGIIHLISNVAKVIKCESLFNTETKWALKVGSQSPISVPCWGGTVVKLLPYSSRDPALMLTTCAVLMKFVCSACDLAGFSGVLGFPPLELVQWRYSCSIGWWEIPGIWTSTRRTGAPQPGGRTGAPRPGGPAPLDREDRRPSTCPGLGWRCRFEMRVAALRGLSRVSLGTRRKAAEGPGESGTAAARAAERQRPMPCHMLIRKLRKYGWGSKY